MHQPTTLAACARSILAEHLHFNQSELQRPFRLENKQHHGTNSVRTA